jgi:UDP-glucose-4-epimerase GalE
MSVLVTGGAGYIGSHTARRLREEGRDVVVLDTLERGHAAAVKGLPLVVGDVADEALVRSVVRRHGVTEVVHFAGYKLIGESMREPARYFRNNVAGSVALVGALRAEKVERVVFSSSCSVYGAAERVPVDERCPLRPASVYAETKATVERVLDWHRRIDGLESVSLRYFNVAGAHPAGDLGEAWGGTETLVPVAMRAALGLGAPVGVFGSDWATPDGTGVRDYVHVCDVAEAHVAALDHLASGARATAFDLGAGRGHSVLEVIAAVERVSGRAVPFERAPRRPGDVGAIWADGGLAARELGWRPTRTLDEIVASSWEWHRRHPRGHET